MSTTFPELSSPIVPVDAALTVSRALDAHADELAFPAEVVAATGETTHELVDAAILTSMPPENIVPLIEDNHERVAAAMHGVDVTLAPADIDLLEQVQEVLVEAEEIKETPPTYTPEESEVALAALVLQARTADSKIIRKEAQAAAFDLFRIGKVELYLMGSGIGQRLLRLANVHLTR